MTKARELVEAVVQGQALNEDIASTGFKHLSSRIDRIVKTFYAQCRKYYDDYAHGKLTADEYAKVIEPLLLAMERTLKIG
jgi:hypothetical protein